MEEKKIAASELDKYKKWENKLLDDRYIVDRILGIGGMSVVYKGRDAYLNNMPIAIKILKDDVANDETVLKRFKAEIRIAQELRHNNIVAVHGHSTKGNVKYMIMEYLYGLTLKKYLVAKGVLGSDEIVSYTSQILRALGEAHRNNIVHRDIKPQNILMLDDGTVKVTDFGIATLVNANELTQTNSVMGSVHYLPPESANGSGSTIRSDIYSLGILMFELLTGKVPFKGDNAVEVAIKQMKEPIPSVTKLNPLIPQAIENIILRACAKNPKNRYKNVTEMRNDIDNALKEENANVRRVVYQYPEQDIEETKNLEDVKEFIRTEKMEGSEKPVAKKASKKGLSLAAWISGTIFLFLTAISLIFIIFYSNGDKKEEAIIPNVAGLSRVEAEKKLKKEGFTIAEKVQEKYSAEIEEGSVIATNPPAGVERVKGKEVTLIISIGSNAIKIENYVGKSYAEVEKMLEDKGLYVFQEKKEVKKGEGNYKAGIIISQSVKAGESLHEGDSITLTVPDIVVTYPDFVSEGYSKSAISAFCGDNNLNCTFEEVETSDYKPGTIIGQNRAAGSVVTAKANVIIKIAVAPTVTEGE